MPTLHKYFPEISAFASWAFVMIFEILGARLLWVYVGTSLFVWTSIIGLILAALSLWYYAGWKLADRWANMESVALLFSLSGFGYVLLPYISSPVLLYITSVFGDVRISSLLATCILFAPVSFLLGMIQPICTKVQLKKIENAWEVIGRIGSIWTVGSIVWTIAAGFFLIPYFGITYLLILLWVFSLFLSLLISPKKLLWVNILIWFVILCTIFSHSQYKSSLEDMWIREIETGYSHITIKDELRWLSPVRNLYVDNVTHAWMYLNKDSLLYPYTQAYHLFDVFHPKAESVLMLWWAAYSFPKSFVSLYPDKMIDVVEIDPDMTRLAKQYFNLGEYDNLSSIHSDGRVYLNTTEKKYDAILGDAFGSYYSIPYQLTTLETVQKKYDILTKDWVVLLNIVSTLWWEASAFLHSQYLTYSKVFPDVQIIPISNPDNPDLVQNIMLIARKNPQIQVKTPQSQNLLSFLERMQKMTPQDDTRLLTDDYAPVDFFTSFYLQ